MFAKVHKPVNTPGVIDNKGTCKALVDYLQKEVKEALNLETNSTFFSHTEDNVTAIQVTNSIDNNHKKLKKKDDKFYMVSFNPSHNECQELIYRCTGNRVSDFNQLSNIEKQTVFSELRDYAREGMDLYAQNFNRQTINDGSDLVYFGRIETQRVYKHDDLDVLSGKVKSGSIKPGLNLHVHVIVSRNDKSQTVTLSPLAKSRGNSWELNGQVVTRGFNHTKWKQEVGTLFAEKYNYIPRDKDIYKPHERFHYPHRSRKNILVTRSGRSAITQAVNRSTGAVTSNQFTTELQSYAYLRQALLLVTAPKQAIVSVLKSKLTNVLVGKELF